ncbi:type I restriction/modification system, M subunit [Campylobacter hyointestinalis subsp. lawsonii CCUG 27631]|uniref:HsdM family class I SAM-dependent methyltransferase n=1 Tax=Campylobacter hyointestinalis TaxID=198 RepID=UPI0007C8B79A|nr:N-6 DNA methylase [Campylobacter hyointestinalis]ANE35000.1 type I restriction/modification system, M subunit [Campylobacter hyointestinalis subsp. lawsonii CCUG 27631]
MAKSIEEKIEDHAKAELKKLNLKYYTKTEIINESIDEALNKAPSKKGGDGVNRPDIKLFIQTATLKNLPVMIEVKGTKGDLAKFDDDGNIANQNSKNEPNYSNISKYALNGAIHYADAVTFYSDFADCIAIGINGYENSGKITIEYAVYLVSNPKIYKKLGDFSDLSFLASSDLDDLIKNCELSQEEIEAKTAQIENEMEVRLKNLNETIHHTYGVAVQYRVEIVVGIIMANLGIANHISPLALNDLKGENTPNSNDGKIILNKISDYLEHKNLNSTKKDMILRELTKVFIDTNLWKSQNGQSRLKQIYKIVLENVMPYLKNNKYHLDFTGQLFNVLNRYVDIPDGEKNDVVLTPRYVTDLMAKLCEVNKDSFVWDYAMGSGGFLISSLKLMLADAKNSINSSSELEDKLFHIKSKQLLGVELRPDICLLAILNMILMGDGSANVINTDSLINYEGNYQDQSTPFPANVFLLNPPYSADGKGFNFVEKALSKMKSGKAAVLIQENAGSANGLPYTKEILKHSTLKASIKMSDIFCGKAGVQTAIYLFEVGRPHNEKSIVKFIDFSNDGYSRQNRKKSGLNVNLKDADNAELRYAEIVDIVLDRKKSSDFYNEANGTLILDTISLNGKDWTFGQHKKIDTKPTLNDFKKCVSDFLAWEVSNIIKNETTQNLNQKDLL